MSKIPAREIYPLPDNNDSSSMAFLTLSIFILLLAFFVVLNTNSNIIEERSIYVISSVERQFAKDFYGSTKDNQDINSDKDVRDSGTSTSDKMQELFTSASIAFELNETKGGNTFFIRLKKQDFDNAISQVTDGISVQGEHQKGSVFERYIALFTQISAMIAPQEKALKYNLSVLLYTKKIDSVLKKDVDKLIKYAKELDVIGINGSGVSFGLKPKDGDFIELNFTLAEK